MECNGSGGNSTARMGLTNIHPKSRIRVPACHPEGLCCHYISEVNHAYWMATVKLEEITG